jgi:hypothetical protein
MAKRTISRSEYLQLVGLLALSNDLTRQLKALERAAGELLREQPDDNGYYGHIGDEIYDRTPSADALLKRLGIAIRPEKKGRRS